jgi:hypothetical protein
MKIDLSWSTERPGSWIMGVFTDCWGRVGSTPAVFCGATGFISPDRLTWLWFFVAGVLLSPSRQIPDSRPTSILVTTASFTSAVSNPSIHGIHGCLALRIRQIRTPLHPSGRNRSPISHLSISWPSHYTDWTTPADCVIHEMLQGGAYLCNGKYYDAISRNCARRNLQ